MKSSLEERIVKELKKQKVKFRYEGVKIPYLLEGNYIPDIILENGIIIELKGYFRLIDQRKMIAVKKSNPSLDIRFVFQKLNSPLQGAKKRKDGTKRTCKDFAEDNGFKYAETSIPKDWIKSK